jgi:murein DD-endopeptidase MepM/ murein hydrolase activator NlpD
MRVIALMIVTLLVAGQPAHRPAESPHVARAALSGHAASAVLSAEAWVWPVSGPRVVLRPFVAPSTAYGPGHRGVDLSAPAHGETVVAVMSGVVHFAGVVVDRPVITVRQGQVLATVEPVDPLVAIGDVVQAGDIIGVLQAGHCARACVHLGVRVAGEYVSPLLWLGGLQRAVLLPMNERRS